MIVENLDYQDLVGMISNKVSIDEYAAKIGKDSEIVTLAFTVLGSEVGKDLCDWFEKGYEFVLDADVSAGEISSGKYLVFVEISRRTKVPEQIITLLTDLKTLTNLSIDEWSVVYNGDVQPVSVEWLTSVVPLSPQDYREQQNNDELSHIVNNAGLEPKASSVTDPELKSLQHLSGI